MHQDNKTDPFTGRMVAALLALLILGVSSAHASQPLLLGKTMSAYSAEIEQSIRLMPNTLKT